MICYDRKEEAGWKQLFQIAALFLGAGVGRAEAGPRLDVGACGYLALIFIKLCWVSTRPVTHRPPLALLIPRTEEKPCLFSFPRSPTQSLRYGNPRTHLPDQRTSVPGKGQPQRWGCFQCNQTTTFTESKSVSGEEARRGPPREIRKWRKAEGRKEPNPSTASSESPLVISAPTFSKLRMNLWEADVLSSSPLLALGL